MNIIHFDLKQDAIGHSRVLMILDTPVQDMSELYAEIQSGKPYTVSFEPKRNKKTDEQRGAIWAKITDIANALYADKFEIYEICLRRYGQGRYMRIKEEDLNEVSKDYRITDIKKRHEDGSITILCYRGLSSMSSAEASRLLDGVLSECKEIGISGEVRNV